jgi:zinc-ribbon domain
MAPERQHSASLARSIEQMAYCQNCGTEVAEAARFCSDCGRWLGTDAPSSPAPTDSAPPDSAPPPSPPLPHETGAIRKIKTNWQRERLADTPSPAPPTADGPSSDPLRPQPASATTPPIHPAALGLNDVPGWLGWLAIPITLTVIGLPIYCIWTYRRGQRDGVGRDPTEQPYRSMGWKTVGWAVLALFVLTLYVAVHLATLWYKHGLRVGARAPSAESGFTSLPSLGVAVGAPIAAIFIGAFSIGVAGGIGGGTGKGPTPMPVQQVTAAPAPPTTAANFSAYDVETLTQSQVTFPANAKWG